MYAIIQKSTRWFMPAFGKNQSKGGTWLEPKAGCVPRLFRRRQDAKVALDCWLKGHLKTSYSLDFEGYENRDYKYEPVPARSADDMEIVAVKIVILGCEL